MMQDAGAKMERKEEGNNSETTSAIHKKEFKEKGSIPFPTQIL